MNRAIRIGILGVVTVVVTFFATREATWNKAFHAGQEAAKGELGEPVTGDIYTLRLVGMRSGKAYDLESSYGHTLNNKPVVEAIPLDAKVGDRVVCILPGGITIIPRK